MKFIDSTTAYYGTYNDENVMVLIYRKIAQGTEEELTGFNIRGQKQEDGSILIKENRYEYQIDLSQQATQEVLEKVEVEEDIVMALLNMASMFVRMGVLELRRLGVDVSTLTKIWEHKEVVVVKKVTRDNGTERLRIEFIDPFGEDDDDDEKAIEVKPVDEVQDIGETVKILTRQAEDIKGSLVNRMLMVNRRKLRKMRK